MSSDGIFYTLQGEGPLVGIPSVFVRLDTCNLRCKWGETVCDAFYTSWHPGNQRMPVQELIQKVQSSLMQNRCSNVVITGGEPTLQSDVLGELVRNLAPICHITIETNGTVFVGGLGPVLVCLSPKLSSSTPTGTQYERLHSKNRWNPGVIREWMSTHQYYFKLVVDTPHDIDEVLSMMGEVGQTLPDPVHVVLMPQGINAQELWSRGKWLAEVCKDIGARFTPRIQIDIWGNKPGT